MARLALDVHDSACFPRHGDSLLRIGPTFQLLLSILRALFPRAASFGRVNPSFHLGTRVNPVEQLVGGHIGDLATTEALLRFGERLGHYR